VRIFLDANILFSAAKSEGFVRRLLDLLVADGHTLCADAYVAEEARRNLATKGAPGLPALQARLDRIRSRVTGDRTHFGRFYGRRLAGVAIRSRRSLAELLL